MTSSIFTLMIFVYWFWIIAWSVFETGVKENGMTGINTTRACLIYYITCLFFVMSSILSWVLIYWLRYHPNFSKTSCSERRNYTGNENKNDNTRQNVQNYKEYKNALQ